MHPGKPHNPCSFVLPDTDVYAYTPGLYAAASHREAFLLPWHFVFISVMRRPQDFIRAEYP